MLACGVECVFVAGTNREILVIDAVLMLPIAKST